jgi:hypothetical protein
MAAKLIALDKAFPQRLDQIVVVIDGATPELAEAAAQSLTDRLKRRPDLYRSVIRPEGGPYSIKPHAMTTATAFGSLWMSKHPGTSSMGKLLALSLVCTLAAAILFQPALMGPPRKINPGGEDA